MNIQTLQTISGWRRRGLAALWGMCATCALPPLYILPLLIPAFAGLFLLIRYATSRRQAFLDGWWWGLGHFVTGLYWMCISLYVNPAQFAWLTPFALFGIPSVLAIYTGLVAFGLYCLSIKSAPLRIVIFAGLWVIIEYARAHLFTGFPWNLIGYVWTATDVTLQSASLIGIYGLSWLTVVVAAMPALFLLRDPAAIKANIASNLLLAVMVLFGFWRLDAYPILETTTRIRIVQANIAESKEWNEEKQWANLRKTADLTRRPGLDAINIVVWPESGVPFFIEPNSELTQPLGNMLPQNSILITGGLRGQGSKKDWKAWNTLFAIDHDGHIVSQYDKHHLVPFGEFIPFRNILPIENIAGGMGDFSRGTGATTLKSGNYPSYSPLICYEAIFPEEATDNTHSAAWLLNITNDAWFGKSSGPWQHLQMARTRSVEQGLPLIRAANTGISAVFDPLGRMAKYLPLQTEGILDFLLPQSLHNKTLVSRFPYAPILFMIALSLFFIIFIT